VSLAAVTARAARLTQDGADACRDCAEALALGRVFERAGQFERAQECYRRASRAGAVGIAAEAVYRLGLRARRDRRFDAAADCWHRLLALAGPRAAARHPDMAALREFAVEALAIHHEHRVHDLTTARELALFALEETGLEDTRLRRADGMRHRLARLDRKIARRGPLLFTT
jgi:tetratricopeptide (TPR) repeat protein